MYSQKTPNGKYRFFESYTDPLTRRSKTVSVTMDRDTQKSRKAAQQALQLRIDMKLAQPDKVSDFTLKQLIKAYTTSKRTTAREQTVIRDEAALNKIADMLGPDTQISVLSARYIKQTFDKSDRKASDKNEKLKRFKACLRWAYRMDYLTDISWLDKLTPYPDNPKERRKEKYLERAELTAVIDAAIPEYARFIKFLALSGLRIGEAICLTKDDITDVIRVNKTQSQVTGVIGKTKTEDSTREVYIQKELRDLLAELPDGKWLFEKDGRQIDYNAFRIYFERLTEKTIKKRLTPHALRHTHTSLLAAAGVPLDVISRRLGHADSSVTKEIYLHVTAELKDRDKALLENLVFA